jgi:hypothetical protein
MNIEKSKAAGQPEAGDAVPPQIEQIPLDRIRSEPATQIRAVIHPATVAEYAKAMTDPVNEFPSVVVFREGESYILADGFHRVAAARQNGFTHIRAEIRGGSQAEALRYALGANTGPGLPRTYKDKRRSVALALAQWPELSTREIARICAVSDPFVAAWKRKKLSLELEPVEDDERRLRSAGPSFESVHLVDAEAEAKRLKYLAETWPATCPQCEKEFRYDKRQREPGCCPACAAEVRECRLCGRPFEPRPGKEFCSSRCATWHAEHGANGVASVPDLQNDH